MTYAVVISFVIGFISGRLVGVFRKQKVEDRNTAMEREEDKTSLVPVIIVSAFCGFVVGLIF